MADIFQYTDSETVNAVSKLRQSLIQMGASVEHGAGMREMKAGTTRWNLPGFGLDVNPDYYPVMAKASLRKKALKKGGLWEKRGLKKAKYHNPYY